MQINVTQKHIDQGKQMDGFHCAIASAITEQTGMTAQVGKGIRWVVRNWLRGRYLTDFAAMPSEEDKKEVGIVRLDGKVKEIGEDAAKFIEAFDKDKKLAQPFSFELDYEPEPTLSPISVFPSPVHVEARELVAKNYSITNNQYVKEQSNRNGALEENQA